MTIEEKIIYTVLCIIFAIAVNFMKHMKDSNKDTISWTPHSIADLFINEDGTEKWFAKPFFAIFFLIWIPIIWIFG